MGLKIPDLDNTTFAQLVEEARPLIARYAPQWTDHNLHDPGLTFIDLFAWLAEMQIYQLNQVTDDLYKKFLQLVGIVPRDAQPAAGVITFQNITGESFIESGTPIFTNTTTQKGKERFVFKTKEPVTLLPLAIKSVKTILDTRVIDNTPANEKDDMYFYAFGESAPKGAELRLGFDRPIKEKDLHLTFEIKEEDLPPGKVPPNPIDIEPPGVFPPVILAWEYLEGEKWKPFNIKNDTALTLNRSGKIVFTGPPAVKDNEEGLYWIRCRLEAGQYEIVPIIDRILLNTVPVLQIETVKEIEDGNGLPDQVINPGMEPINRNNLVIEVKGDSDEWETWEEIEDFEWSGPDDPHYVFNPLKKEITFGNGQNGRIPKESRRIRATYETTLGSRGNIAPDQDFYIDKQGLEGIKGTNLKPTAGGKDAESIEQAINRARKDLKYLYRAVTPGDYEELALETPVIKVARAKALPGYNADYPCISLPGAITVVVVPYTREGTVTPVPGEGFLRTVRSHLERYRLIAADLYVIAPGYVKISVHCQVHLYKKSSPLEMKKRVLEALAGFLDPLKGGPGKNGWTFGRPVFPSEIYHVIDKVEGVDYASAVSIDAEGEFTKEEGIIKINPTALVFSGEHQVEVL
jgi:hypothetical protein